MAILVKRIRNNKRVIFDRGSFDDWCVYVVSDDGSRKAPYDTKYFSDLKKISTHYKENKVYDDFVTIYNKTSDKIDEKVLSIIEQIVETYNEEHKELIEQWFTVIYAGLIAEENKQYTILKKRIKRLGLHQVLILGFKPEIAANFSKGKKWRELDSIMKAFGF